MKTARHTGWSAWATGTIATLLLCWLVPLHAAVPVQVKISAQPVGQALKALAQQTGIQLLVDADVIPSGAVAPAVEGHYALEEVLTKLLAGTSLEYDFINAHTVAIRGAKEKGGQRTSDSGLQGGGAIVRMARVDAASDAASSVAGQSSEEKDPGTTNSKVEEVVVTASRRGETRLQDVPMSIAVISSQDIERRGLIGMQDYLRSIPGANQIERGNDNAVVLRGITTSPQSENANSGSGATVAMYFDEAPITGAAGAGAGGIDIRPVDLARIEVLRGPQGTSYGDASLGGAVRLIPAKPNLERFGAKVAASYSNTGGYGSDNGMMQGVLNIPVVDGRLALRAVGYRYDESGFYRNIGGDDPALIAFAGRFGLADFVRGHVQNDVGRTRTDGGRISALWKPMDKLDFTASYLKQEMNQDGLPVATIGKFEQSRAPIAAAGRVSDDSGETNDTEIELTSLGMNYDFGWAGLTSTASWVDSGSAYATGAMSSNGAVLGVSSNTLRSAFESFTGEMRLTSRFNGRFQFLAGAFYQTVDERYHQNVDWPGTAASNPVGTSPMVTFDLMPRELDQRAAFGEISYELVHGLTATVGARYFDYDKSQTVLQEGGLLGVPIGAGISQYQQNTKDGTSYKANLSYKPTADSLVYASWAQGFRLGRPAAGLPPLACDRDNDGIVDGTSVTLASTRIIDSDFLDNYEIGSKLLLFDRRLSIDAAVYHINWDGLPIRSAVPCGNYTANVGGATSDGVELQTSLFVTEGLKIDFGGGYTNARLSKDAPGIVGSPKKGARLPGAPKVSVNLSAQYDFEIAGRKAFMRADSFYVDEFYGDLLQTPLTSAGDYIKLDVRVGVEIERLSVELFGRNLTNEDTFTWRGLSNANTSFGYRMQPRTVGVQIGYSFD